MRKQKQQQTKQESSMFWLLLLSCICIFFFIGFFTLFLLLTYLKLHRDNRRLQEKLSYASADQGGGDGDTQLSKSLLAEGKWERLIELCKEKSSGREENGSVGGEEEGEEGEERKVVVKKKKKRGKKKRLDVVVEEEDEEKEKGRDLNLGLGLDSDSDPGRLKPELVCMYPFTSTGSATQRKIKQQYDQLVKCHESKGLTLDQVIHFFKNFDF